MFKPTTFVRNGARLLIAGAFCVCGVAAQAQFSGLYDTGVNSANGLLASGASDPYWARAGNGGTGQGIVVGTLGSSWVANQTGTNPPSKWIGVNGTTSSASAGATTYTTTFTLGSNYNPVTAQITGMEAAGSYVNSVTINGASAQITTNGLGTAAYSQLHPFTISGGFQTGVNTLVFSVQNASTGPTGIQVNDLAGTANQLIPGDSPIIELYGTGVDNTRTALTNGQVDPHYTLVSTADPTNFPVGNIYENGSPNAIWYGNTTLTQGVGVSRWIGPTNGGNGNFATGNYDYRQTFNLSHYNLSTVIVNGEVAVDDTVTVEVNGHVLTLTAPPNVGVSPLQSFSSFNFSDAQGWLNQGQNTIDFIVNNGVGPTGLNVEMFGQAVSTVPGPNSLLMLSVGFSGLLPLVRRARVRGRRLRE